ncbi:hypothetical protein ERJ76_05895 [Vibrio anguillarum]|nr:hypothetical protein [Vibrio anguillarum]
MATFVHPNHIVCLCSWGLTHCRLPATPSCLGIASKERRETFHYTCLLLAMVGVTVLLFEIANGENDGRRELTYPS